MSTAVLERSPKRVSTAVQPSHPAKSLKTSPQGKALRRFAALAKSADEGRTVKLAGKSDQEILKLICG